MRCTSFLLNLPNPKLPIDDKCLLNLQLQELLLFYVKSSNCKRVFFVL